MTFVLAGQAATVPTAPVISVGSPTTNSLTISLVSPASEPNFGISGYDLERSTNGLLWIVLPSKPFPYIDLSVSAGTLYKYRARGICASYGYRSPASTIVSASTLSPTTARIYVPGHYVALSQGDTTTGGVITGIPNPGVISKTGPGCTGIKGFLPRMYWKDMEPTDGGYTFTKLGLMLDQCASFSPKMYMFLMIVVRTFDGSTGLSGADPGTDPAPPRLSHTAGTPHTFQFGPSGPQNKYGFQIARWSPVVTAAWDALMVAMAAYLATHPNRDRLAGIATQETSSSQITADGYSPAKYGTALLAESDSIMGRILTARHLGLVNSIFQDNSGSATLPALVTGMLQNGAILAFPDLVTQGGLINNVYPWIKSMHDQGGATGGSIQNAEWSNIAPADPANPRTLQQLMDYLKGIRNDDNGNPSKLHCDYLFTDWHQAITGNGTQKFNPDYSGTSGLVANNPSPFGSIVLS